jgi:hypothetical protein
MLHPIPDSALRHRLLAVLAMQAHLLKTLCRLPDGANFDLAGLQRVWPHEPAEWTRRFWENDSGNRATWCRTIAAASSVDKRGILNRCREHLRYVRLYHPGSGFRLTEQNWNQEPFKSVKQLLTSFYDPMFYTREGYHEQNGDNFTKDAYLAALVPKPKVCPYTDTPIQLLKLDHFLPKDRFPILACYPDNLIPCGTDANSGQLKGTETPLDMEAADQAAHWFHPHLRPAVHKQGDAFIPCFRITFDDSGVEPRVAINALDRADERRVANLVRMFALIDFWGKNLDDEVQHIAGEIADDIRDSTVAVDEASVRRTLDRKGRQMARRIGHDDRAIVKTAFIAHIASSPSLFDQILRTCSHGA